MAQSSTCIRKHGHVTKILNDFKYGTYTPLVSTIEAVRWDLILAMSAMTLILIKK